MSRPIGQIELSNRSAHKIFSDIFYPLAETLLSDIFILMLMNRKQMKVIPNPEEGYP